MNLASRRRAVSLSSSFLLALAGLGCGDNLGGPPPDGDPGPDAPPAARCDEATLAEGLGALAGVTAVEESACGDYVQGPARCFLISVDQPIDHATPGGEQFTQHLYLAHRGCDRPTVVADWGYSNDLFFDDELTQLYQTNSLWIEHRFQGASIPAPDAWDWTALTIENGAADMHEVIAALRPFYAGRWVSTGASKGGITATYHRYLHPDDVDGSIPYVAPASHSRIDPAYQDRLATALPEPCAQRVRDVQVDALTTRRAMMLQQITDLFGPGAEDTILEYLTASFDWGYWQYDGLTACPDVPTAAATDDEFWQFYYQYSGLGFVAAPAPTEPDPERSYGALDYEWLTEQGFALQVGPHVASLLVDPWATQSMEDSFRGQFPEVVLPAYDGAVTAAARAWVRDAAERVLLIYGDLDPWSGGAMDAPTRPTSGRYFVPNANHGARLVDLDPADEAAALALASAMFGQDPVAGKAAARHAGVVRDQILERAQRRAMVEAVRRRALATGSAP